MTVVIAQRFGNHVSFSSDSRISFGNQGYIDFGIKIFSVPVKIFSPTNDETKVSTLDYSYQLGLAVIGSAMNSYTVKESVYEILQHLQYLPGYTDLSMDGLSRLVFKVFNKTSLDLGPILRYNGLCEIILGGYCPKEKRVRVFKLSVRIHPDRIEPYYEEILQNDSIQFFGTGKDEAQRISNENNRLSPLHIIRQIIDVSSVDSVGGGLQYGEFVNNNFKVFGVVNYDLYPDGTFNEYLYTLRGINLYKDEFDREYDGFHVAYTFKEPFREEITEIINRLLKED